MSEDDKEKVLDIQFSKEEQEKNPELLKMCAGKEWKLTIEINGKVRFMYGDDPTFLEMVAKGYGAKIIKVTRL